MSRHAMRTRRRNACPPCSFCGRPSVITAAIAGPGIGRLQEIHGCHADDCREFWRDALDSFSIEEPSCIYCGCDDWHACFAGENGSGPCHWVSRDPWICSAPACLLKKLEHELAFPAPAGPPAEPLV